MATNSVYRLGGYDPAHPSDNLAEQWSNGTQPTDPPAGYTAWDDTGKVTEQRALTATEHAELDAQDAATGNDPQQPVTADPAVLDAIAAAARKATSITALRTQVLALLDQLNPTS